jgi:hypothetical protein
MPIKIRHRSIVAHILPILLLPAWMGAAHAQNAPDVQEIVKRADYKMRGATNYCELKMTVLRPGWSRSIEMKSWSKGREFSVILITAPANEKGQVFLKRHDEMWNWLPSISRTIKLPPSMMMQSWMGSDFTNDDLIKESSLVLDYVASFIAIEEIQGTPCYKIELVPKPDAAVVWGKIHAWISVQGDNELKMEYFDEDGNLMHRALLSDIRRMNDREIPTRMEMISLNKDGQSTVLEIVKSVFDQPIADTFFSMQNAKRLR